MVNFTALKFISVSFKILLRDFNVKFDQSVMGNVLTNSFITAMLDVLNLSTYSSVILDAWTEGIQTYWENKILLAVHS